ncbi:hypothetical protein OQA88_4619 [Cercophora sp. LCS_1]
MDPRLCSICRIVFEDPEHAQIRDPNRPGHLRHDYFASGVHHKSAKSFWGAVDCQCPICVTLFLNYSTSAALPLDDPTANGYTTYNIDYGCGDPSSKPPKLPRFSINFFVGKMNFGPSAPPYLKLLSLHPSDATKTLAPTSTTTDLHHIKDWVQDCISSHPTCRPPKAQSFHYPTRLLRVSQPGDASIQLIETATTPLNGPYNVLSYRWGTSQPTTLLKSTLTSFLTSIPLSTLPQTLIDAVTVTRAMSVSYLWIDALCIIQDSPSDWAHEATTMASVYGNAHCSLAASHNTDSTGGLFPRRLGSGKGRPITIIFPSNCEWDIPFHEMQLVEHNFWNNRVEDAPLNTRGWVVQERILAPRTVHFGFDQALFECRAARKSMTRFDLGIEQRHRRLILPSKDMGKEELTRYWSAVVQFYTGRELSFVGDRAVAIAGIARAVQGGGRYVAGLWEGDLERWLFWEGEGTTKGKGTGDRKGSGGYRAPSWSWLSVDGRVFYDTDLIQGFRYLRTGIHARVVRWRIVTADGSGFGEIKAGLLELRGVLWVAYLEKKGKEVEAKLRGHELTGTGLGEWVLKGDLSWSWDMEISDAMAKRSEGESGNVFVLPVLEMTPTKDSEDACLYALAIERVDVGGRSDVYRRVGILTVFGTTRVAPKDEGLDVKKTLVKLV